MSAQRKKRFVAVGTGGRVTMFIDPIARDYSDKSELVGLCDPSETRMRYHQKRLQESYGYHEVPMYPIEDFDRMIEETKPDSVIVTTVDAYHHEYIIRALEKGLDVVTEKPMTVDAEKCRAILEAHEKSPRDIRVTFNYRWSPGVTAVKQEILKGTIGKVHSVNLEYLLNTSHGADYFRRWHSDKSMSGGLLVHKSTHHFDLVNWWIDSIPQEVFAYGDLVFYGKKNAIARGDEKLTKYDRYTGQATTEDPFALFLDDKDNLKNLYLDAEKDSGYIRDMNVFREGITIEDTMSVLVKYRSGVSLTYSLNAFAPWEGFRVSFNGDKGRIEYFEAHGTHLIAGQSDEELAKEQTSSMKPGKNKELIVRPLFGDPYEIKIVEAKGGHGGGDPLIQRQIFDPEAPKDEYHRNAGHEQGAASILIGIAANQSIKDGKPVRVGDLCLLKPNAVKLSELT